MINVIKKILYVFKLFGDLILSIILLIFYLIFLFPYKLFSKKKNHMGWIVVEKYNLENKSLPF